MGVKNAMKGGAVAGIGMLSVFFILIALLFKLALLVIVLGGAYFVLEHFGVLMAGVPL